MVLESVFNPVLGPIMRLPEPFALLAISFLITLITTVIYKYTTDQELLKSIKLELKELKAEAKSFKEDPKKMMEINKKMMEKSMKQMTQSWKSMIITFVPVILIFGWLSGYYKGIGNPDILFGLSWFWSYLIFSIIFNFALRALLKVH